MNITPYLVSKVWTFTTDIYYRQLLHIRHLHILLYMTYHTDIHINMYMTYVCFTTDNYYTYDTYTYYFTTHIV